MKLLGIDFGEKNIGLAIAEGPLAAPLGTVKRMVTIQKICQQQGIEKIVIGLSEGLMGQKTQRFGASLSQLTGLPVVYQDETLTSVEAEIMMIKSAKPRRKRRTQRDAFSACLILQNYLDTARGKPQCLALGKDSNLPQS